MTDNTSKLVQIFQEKINQFQIDEIQRFIIDGDRDALRIFTREQQILAQQQREWRIKAMHKVPTWVSAGVFIPSRIALEQSTSEEVALYRAGLARGKSLLNLTGGMGVDDWSLASSFDNIISIDISEELNLVAGYNFQRLKINNVNRITMTADQWLAAHPSDKFDIIYADPDRRAGGRRSALWADASPDMEALLPNLRARAKEVWVKSSPLTNPDEFINRYRNEVQCQIIELDNEIKEILYRFTRVGFKNQRLAIVLKDGQKRTFDDSESAKIPLITGVYQKYLLEPPPAVIKAGLANSFASQFGLDAVMSGNFWFTSSKIPEEYCGRLFEVLEVHEYKPRKIQEYLKLHGITRALVAKRQFPHSTDEIRKTLKLKEGGEQYLLFTRDRIGLKMIKAKRLDI